MKKLILLLSILTTSCGFKSIYNESNQYNLSDSLIVINHNKDFNTRAVEAKYLNLLHKELNIDKNSYQNDYSHKIEIYLNWYQAGSLRKGSGSLSRVDVILKADYQIKDMNGKIIYKDDIKTIDSLDISASRFTNHSLENFVIDNLIISSVNDLKNKIVNLTIK